jgi:uncharacterized integral membrane protein
MIRTILFMTALFFVFFFLVNNRDLVIAIQIYPGGSAKPIPLYLLILGTFLTGFILSVFMIFPGWLRLKLESRRQKKEIESLVEEVGHLRTAPSITPSTPPSASSETDSSEPL